MKTSEYIVYKPEDLPAKPGPHYAILTFRSVTIPGDERSRTNPGHGYPEYTEHYSIYTLYPDRKEWEQEIARLTVTRERFIPLVATPATVKMHCEVKA